METKDYLSYIVHEIHTTIVATVDDEGLPVTAAIDMMDSDENSLYFLTAKGKGFYDRLVRRGFLALTAIKGETTMSSVAAGFNSMVMGASIGDEMTATEEKTSSQILDEFSGYFDYLYGRSYDGYLWDYEEMENESENYFDGYDRTDVPTSNMGSYVYDFDQDGQEELLIVHISSDYKLQFSMYEITDEKKVYAADTYTLLNITGEYEHEQFAIEQGGGETGIYLYEFDGPRLLALCSGTGMLATGHMSHLIPVKYDGHKFVQDIEPCGYNKYAGFPLQLIDNYRSIFQSFGAGSLSDEACEEIFNNLFSITKYLEKPREIARASTRTENDYYQKYKEWRQGSKDERFKATTIYFSSKEELMDSAD